MDDREIQEALKACLAECAFPEERQRAVIHQIREENTIMRKKLSVTVVFALGLMLALAGAAIAAGLGVFGQSAGDSANEQSAARLEKLEEAASVYDETVAMAAPEAAEPMAAPATDYEEMAARLYSRRFNLTLNQAYFDGCKLYYAYTLTTDSPLEHFSGTGVPTGFDSWLIESEGKYVGNWSDADPEVDKRRAYFFAANPIGWVASEEMSVGDGARTADGVVLNVYDSGVNRVDDHTIQGYQEVRLPEGYAADDEIEIELSVLYSTSVFYQDEAKVYFASLHHPENCGVFLLPFTVKLDGKAEMLTGSVACEAYTAEAAVRVSDVDIAGEVVFDAPEWAAAFEHMDAHDGALPGIAGYVLEADGRTYANRDGSIGVNEDGRYCIGLQFDLPENASNLVLRPTKPQTDEPQSEYIDLE